MILKRAHIKNFRSIRDCEVEFGNHTAIVGGNGAGKSTILRAVERFYSQSNSLSLDDFFGGSTTEPIQIELTFGDLNAEEADQFKSRLHGGELSVVRIFDAKAGKQSGKYYGRTLQHPAFASIRNTPGANEKRAAYNALRAASNYSSLQAVTSAGQIEDQLKTWEHLHPDEMQLTLDDGQFLGFTNVGRGSLQRYTKFVFIPAVREASADAQDGKGAVIAELMELVVRSAIEKRSEIRDFQSEVSKRYKDMTSPEKLTELGDLSGSLTTTLKRFYFDAAVNLKWRESDDLSLPLPLADVFLNDDGFEGPVDRKGHGLQRALILTLLQHLAHASASATHVQETQGASETLTGVDIEQPELSQMSAVANEGVPAQAPPVPHTPDGQLAEPEEISSASSETSGAFILPSLILAIEEPELYQHPTKQRHFAKVLHDLSVGTVPGVAARTQVLFATHSSLFVSPERFDEIRLARRQLIDGTSHKECVLSRSTLEAICRKQEIAFDELKGSRSIEGLRSRLHVIGPELSEGFFADVAVVVEGASDRAALVAASSIAGVNFEEKGIAILVASGKTGLLNPVCIFQELKIPVYCLWDSDRGKKDAHVDHNRALQRLCGVEDAMVVDYPQMTRATGACFEADLEAVVRHELGADLYDKLLDEAASMYSLEGRKGVSKSPAAMKWVLTRAQDQGRISATLAAIVAAIFSLGEAAAQIGSQSKPKSEIETPNAA